MKLASPAKLALPVRLRGAQAFVLALQILNLDHHLMLYGGMPSPAEPKTLREQAAAAGGGHGRAANAKAAGSVGDAHLDAVGAIEPAVVRARSSAHAQFA